MYILEAKHIKHWIIVLHVIYMYMSYYMYMYMLACYKLKVCTAFSRNLTAFKMLLQKIDSSSWPMFECL